MEGPVPMGEPKDVVTWMPAGPGIWRVTMASPPANALSGRLLDGLHAAEAAGDVKVLVVSSAVDRFFAAGADIKHMATIDAASFAAYGDRMRAVNDRLADGDAAEAALALAGELAAASLPAQRAVVAAVDAACDLPLGTGLSFEAERVQALFVHGEAAEGIAAFTEKRPPRFA